MQSNILQKTSNTVLSLKASTGQLTQVRNHVKMWPWRENRANKQCYLDNTEYPYTDRFNINEFRRKTRQLKPWMKVIPKEKENRFNDYKWNESYKSDPVEARETAKSRFDRFTQSIRERGSARECQPYDPPGEIEVQDRIISLYKSSMLQGEDDNVESDEQGILDINLDENRSIKFKLIAKCIEEFKHDLPSSCLNEISTISDLVGYFSTPVRGYDPYSAMLKKSDSLPVNLHLIPEPIRYNRESDDKFGGYNALPGLISQIPGLRAKKKYPILNQDEFQWPDI